MSLANLPFPYTLDRTTRGPVRITGFDEHALHVSGRNNDGTPAQGFADKLAQADEEEFLREAAQVIWLSAFASNNPTSDWHWQAHACYYEAQRRGDENLYQRAYDSARNG